MGFEGLSTKERIVVYVSLGLSVAIALPALDGYDGSWGVLLAMLALFLSPALVLLGKGGSVAQSPIVVVERPLVQMPQRQVIVVHPEQRQEIAASQARWPGEPEWSKPVEQLGQGKPLAPQAARQPAKRERQPALPMAPPAPLAPWQLRPGRKENCGSCGNWGICGEGSGAGRVEASKGGCSAFQKDPAMAAGARIDVGKKDKPGQ